MFYRYTSRWLVCLCVITLMNTRVPSAEFLTLSQAVQRSAAASPLLAAETHDVDAAEARARREALPPPWFVSAELENFAGSGALSGLDAAETTLRLGRVIELGGKRAARESLGEADVAHRQHQTAVARLRVAAIATARFIELVADQQRLRLAEQHVAQAQSARSEIARWVEAARNPETDLHAAELNLADAELEREHAEHELASARVTLASTWGALSADFDGAVGSLAELPEAPSLDELSKRLPEAAAQRSIMLDAQAGKARRELARANASPDLTMNVGVRRLEAFEDHGLVLSLSMPLGSRPRAALSMAEADAQLAATGQRRQATLADTHQALFEKYQELVHAQTEHGALRRSMLPKAEQALGLAQRGFDSGRFSFVTLTQAQNTLHALRRRDVDAAVRYHTLLVELEHLTAVIPEAAP
ncbi:MAG TPA: TolC family protein [Steroidobacteraceae bacterium]|nr:TolC family protein [Steroidobacteraceae bacterium]